MYQHIVEYPPIDGMSNPLTRSVARRLVNPTWERTLNELDFPYSMTSLTIEDVQCVHIKTENFHEGSPIIIYTHAGAFIAGSARINAAAVIPSVQLSGCEAYSVEYTLAPEKQYPVQRDEVLTVYSALRKKYGHSRKIILMGDSAGGNIALSAALKLRDEGDVLPDQLVLLSPSLDGLVASDTMITLCKKDPLIKRAGIGSLKSVFKHYAGDTPLDDPGVSPIYADLTGMPGVLLHVGSREALLGDSARLSEAARRFGVKATLRVFDGMFHLFHLHWSLPEAKSAHEDIADFITQERR